MATIAAAGEAPTKAFGFLLGKRNFNEVRQKLAIEMVSLYGQAGTVIEDNRAFVIRPVLPEDYTPPLAVIAGVPFQEPEETVTP